ncbi:MAG: hypothetical protein KatS3mg030_160 [Saprospiraceae bacterium]|nr:MAG: hypothetical protein KatS3mg030_160 [Saprospiraceae bacterium]
MQSTFSRLKHFPLATFDPKEKKLLLRLQKFEAEKKRQISIFFQNVYLCRRFKKGGLQWEVKAAKYGSRELKS